MYVCNVPTYVYTNSFRMCLYTKSYSNVTVLIFVYYINCNKYTE